jgi:spore maturation protein CgeB
MVWFRSVQEGIRLIDFYLNNDQAREELAARQRAHFLEHHSWEARLRDLERLLERLL